MMATFNHPQGLAIDRSGNVFVTDLDAYVVRRVSPDGRVTTIAGTGRAGFADGEALQAQFFGLEACYDLAESTAPLVPVAGLGISATSIHAAGSGTSLTVIRTISSPLLSA